MSQLPNQRWHIAPAQPKKTLEITQTTGLLPLTAQVLINRGMDTPETAQTYIDPEQKPLPSPLEEFPDLAKSVELLKEAIRDYEKIVICGDYDADGMTSTALLIRALRHLGAEVDYAIPSRMSEGYGINTRIVEDCAKAGIGLILTVDNGISAYEPIQRAVELGISVIITDHHDLPDEIPPADAILNPKLIPETSPYRGLAGVGVAYILAITLAQDLGQMQGLNSQLMELFTLGTIADLAPLVGVNRRWLKQGLKLLPKSEIKGVQALMQVAGVTDEKKTLKPDDIGFRLGPRINAIGRISDPQIVIELLTTEDEGVALEKAMQCEQINHSRQQLCEEIEHEAIQLIRETKINLQQKRVLVLVKAGWHHGVIGIVASRLVERYGVPTFICTYEDDEEKVIRGSARSIPEFNVFDALNSCKDILGKFGGHKAAGGFSLSAENLEAFQEGLSNFAHTCLEIEHLKPLVKIDAEASFSQLSSEFYEQIDSLHPWGIGNEEPVFLSSEIRVVEQRKVGKNHLKVTFLQDGVKRDAIAWRWADYLPLPSSLDIAYKIRENHFNGSVNLELELVGAKSSTRTVETASKKANFTHNGRSYACSLWDSLNELRIKNDQGKILAVTRGQKQGLLGISREDAQPVNVTQQPYYDLIKRAIAALDKQ